MTTGGNAGGDQGLVLVEPDHRLVVLARTLQADPPVDHVLAAYAADVRGLGTTCLGRALYRHRNVYQNGCDAPIWSHLELNYFHGLVPVKVIEDLVAKPQADGLELLRAEILSTTPGSFVLPRGWNGAAVRPNLLASLEFIDVAPEALGDYRSVMRGYCGPAAQRLVRAGTFGTFRAMETAAVLHHDPALTADWNQIHLCELDPEGFDGFGKAFAAALRETPLDGPAAPDAFADLDGMRSVPRWTFNDAVIEADRAVGENVRSLSDCLEPNS